MKVIFLHIPKTAGQSVHAALVNGFGRDAVCPARVNEHLRDYTIAELNRYQVFSGHMDWSLLDCVSGPRYVFTILRDPMERLLSFYFYLRKQGEAMPPGQLELKTNQGLKAACTLSPDEYFAGKTPLRGFIDRHYDNFYTYYFAGRHFKAHGDLAPALARGRLSRERLLDMARDNLAQLDAVFTMDDMPRVFETIRTLAPKSIRNDDNYRSNINQEVKPGARLAKLRELGASDATVARIERLCAMDRVLWDEFAKRDA